MEKELAQDLKTLSEPVDKCTTPTREYWRAKLQKFDKQELIDIIVEFKIMQEKDRELTAMRKQVIRNLAAKYQSNKEIIFPLREGDRLLCPTCKVDLEAHHSNGVITKESFIDIKGMDYTCPICGFNYFKQWMYKD